MNQPKVALNAILPPSQTLAVKRKVIELRGEGHEIFDLSVGQPDLDPPQSILDYAINALLKRDTGYTPALGLKEARSLIAQYQQNITPHLELSDKNIALTPGTKLGIYLALKAIIDPGDEVIIIKPAWPSYIPQIKSLGGIPIVIDTNDDLQISEETLANAIQSSTKLKAIIINSPNNPSGIVYTNESIEAVANIVPSNCWIISDDIYSALMHDGTLPWHITNCEKLFERTIIVSGFSKPYCVPGLRMGYMTAPEEVITIINGLQSNIAGNQTSILQCATRDITDKFPCDHILEMRAEYSERARFAVESLQGAASAKPIRPKAAFYLFINIREINTDCKQFCEELLLEKKVAITPGAAFEMPGFVRMALVEPKERLATALLRFNNFCNQYNQQI